MPIVIDLGVFGISTNTTRQKTKKKIKKKENKKKMTDGSLLLFVVL